MNRTVWIAVSIFVLATAAPAQDLTMRPVGSAPELNHHARGGGLDDELWSQGGPDGRNGLSNAVESVFGARRTLLFDFVVPEGQTWHVDEFQWLHKWLSVDPGSGTGVELRLYSDDGGQPGSPITALIELRSYEEYATFNENEALSIAGLETVTLEAGTYWTDATIIGPENNFWETAEIANGTEVWVDYADFGGLQPGSTVFGVAYDINGVIMGTAEGGYTLTITGQCPGVATIEWGGATPNRAQGVVLARRTGRTVIPSGQCAGTVLGLEGGVHLRSVIGTRSGSGKLSFAMGSCCCANFLQLVESGSCNTSNVAQLPG